jgi:hypothetical protein
MTNIPSPTNTKLQFETWLLEEYKLLCDQYKHEDTQFLATLSFFTTLQSGLLAFVTSTFASSKDLLPYFVPCLGLLLCFPWALGMLRLIYWRDFLEQRIKEIEEFANAQLTGAAAITIGNIRRCENWDRYATNKLFANFRWSYTMISLPFLFAVIWISLGLLKCLMP